ncbi:MAG: MltA domain-containing protein [Deltaproteobacteria bacterium]|nr:MltA domain-containing protein [Deltaproteobacteria bacterium]
MNWFRVKSCVIWVFVLLLAGCYPALQREPTRPSEALVQVRFFYPRFKDDMDFRLLAQAINRNIEYLKKLGPEHRFSYGPHDYTSAQVLESQLAFLDMVKHTKDPREIARKIKREFFLYRAAGRVGNRHVLFTGYFEPTYEASLVSYGSFKYPIYSRPDDLVKIDLALFRPEFKGKSIVAKIVGNRVLPYHSRRDIEEGKALRGKGLEIAWLKDPLDVAFLHIQGSGRLILPDGEEIHVGYASSNGRSYRSIGRYLIQKGLMDRENMSMQGIRNFLRRHPQLMEEVLNYNPSYIFFRRMDDGPYGNINVLLTPGRSLALDSRLFPRGALCFISAKKPVINESGEIVRWERFSRFVVNQDTGGAIRGAGRADLFWGSGRNAQIAAGHMRQEGDLYVLIKKPGK